jgi:hypothetical protein
MRFSSAAPHDRYEPTPLDAALYTYGGLGWLTKNTLQNHFGLVSINLLHELAVLWRRIPNGQ